MPYTNAANASSNGKEQKRYSFCELTRMLSVTEEGIQEFLHQPVQSMDAASFFFNTSPKSGGVRLVFICAIGNIVKPDSGVKPTQSGGVFHFQMPLENVSQKIERCCEVAPETQGDTVWVRWSAFDNEHSHVATRLSNYLAKHPNESTQIVATGILSVTKIEKNGKIYVNTEATLNNFRVISSYSRNNGQTRQSAQGGNQQPQQFGYGYPQPAAQPQQNGYSYQQRGAQPQSGYGYPQQAAQPQQALPAQKSNGYNAANAAPAYNPGSDDSWGTEDIDEMTGELPF